MKMINWIKELFPICRSITGNGTRKTLSYFEKINPELKRIKFKTGTKVYDWKIPMEWNIDNAYVSKNNKKIIDFKNNNLHVVSYSHPINQEIDLKKLLKNIHTDKKRPGAIPYVTSYYQKNWGFCMQENLKKKLKPGKYKVFIDSKFTNGHLECSHAHIKGKFKKEIFFSSYVCHPSMANNELSGPVLLNKILLYVKTNYPNTKYSYRFFLGPETIGAISYLSKFYKTMKKNTLLGFNLSCVGDENNYSLVQSRTGDTLADKALYSAIFHFKNKKVYDFLKRGSDERQYCSPGIDLPVATFCKTRFGDYPEYHTSDDNLKIVSEKGLMQSFKVMKNIIDALEVGAVPVYKYRCEPNLGKRSLYPQISKRGGHNEEIKLRRSLLAYSDGVSNLFEIAIKLKEPLDRLIKEYKILLKNKLLNNKYL
tara:strand:+ start:1275 stop:2546 length:1272 start_codon:yes stop_codon:yes gene_type:complete